MQAGVPLSNRAKPAPWYRHRWPWLLALGPVLVVVAGVHTTWLAFSHQDALVVGDYYKQGKAINQDLRRDHAAAALQLELKLGYDPANGKLEGSLDSGGRAYPVPLTIRLNHSTLPEKDVTLVVQPDHNGLFEAALPMLDMARWQVTVEDTDREWRLAGRWMWPQQTALRILGEPPVLPE